MKRSSALILAMAAGLGVAMPAHADHSWNGYHWGRSANPFTLTVNYRLSGEWTESFDMAVADWSKSSVMDLKTKAVTADPRKCNPIAGQILVCNYAYGFRGWLGIASIWLSNGHISKATTKLNDSYYRSPPYNTKEWRALVMCQEIGHDFGLDHQDETFDNPNLGTCMDYTNSPGTNQHPNAHDYEMLENIYLHADSVATISNSTATNFGLREFGRQASPAAGDDESAGDSPAEWGRAVRFDSQGRPDMFEKDLGQGRSKVTHVFWVPGPRAH